MKHLGIKNSLSDVKNSLDGITHQRRNGQETKKHMKRTIQKEAQRKMRVKKKQGISKFCDSINYYNKK